MSKLTLADLRALRADKRKDMASHGDGHEIQVVVGMGTCGIAAGAKGAYSAMVDAVAEKDLGNVVFRQTGCMGLCHAEPNVEVIVPGMPRIIYGGVTPAVAREIVEKHIIGRQLLDGYIFDYPAGDILADARK